MMKQLQLSQSPLVADVNYAEVANVAAVAVIHHICINLLVPRYTKTNIGNPGNQQN